MSKRVKQNCSSNKNKIELCHRFIICKLFTIQRNFLMCQLGHRCHKFANPDIQSDLKLFVQTSMEVRTMA